MDNALSHIRISHERVDLRMVCRVCAERHKNDTENDQNWRKQKRPGISMIPGLQRGVFGYKMLKR
jgi:hypothetical protein